MSEQVIIGGDPERYIAGAAARYHCLMGGGYWKTASIAIPMPTAGTLKKLRVQLTGAPGDGKSYQIYLSKGGVEQALSVTISGASDTAGSDDSNEISVVAGDLVELVSIPTNTPTDRACTFSLEFIPTVDNESIHFAYIDNEKNSDGDAYHQVVSGYGSEVGAVLDKAYAVVPTGGTLKLLYAIAFTAPGAGNSRTFTVYKDGGDTGIVAAIADTDTKVQDTTHSQAVSAGDLFCVKLTNAGGPASSKYGWSFVFLASTAGEFPIFNCGVYAPAIDAVTYQNPCGSYFGEAWDATEANVKQITRTMAITKMYVNLTTAPGADSKSYAFMLREDEGDTDVTVTISTTATTGNDTAHTHAFTDNHYVAVKCTPANAPATTYPRISLCGYISDAPSGPSIASLDGIASALINKVAGIPWASIAKINGVG